MIRADRLARPFIASIGLPPRSKRTHIALVGKLLHQAQLCVAINRFVATDEIHLCRALRRAFPGGATHTHDTRSGTNESGGNDSSHHGLSYVTSFLSLLSAMKIASNVAGSV